MECAAIDLFCGIGGLTHGFEQAGITVIAGIDIDGSCKFAYEKNNRATFINNDIEELNTEDLAKLYPDNTIKILMGCAPCQPFSQYTKRYRKNGKKHEKWNLLFSFSNLVKGLKPEIISMENVPQLIKESVFKDYVMTLEKMNYHIFWEIVFCPDYGVPQNRKRLVLLASKLGEISLIPPIHKKENYLTVRHAIEKLPPIRDGEVCKFDTLHRASLLSKTNKKRIMQSKQGGTWKDWDEELILSCHKKKTGKGYSSVYGRMEWDKPSPTITTKFYGYGMEDLDTQFKIEHYP